MIKSDIIKIKKTSDINTEYIESEIHKIYKKIVRWAITEVTDVSIVLSVSFEE